MAEAPKKAVTLRLLWGVAILWLALPALAAPQVFGPVTFQLPNGWGCQVKDNNLICLDNSPTSEKNAALILNYKYKTPEDMLTVYRDQLARPRPLQDGDTTKPSIPQGLRDVVINGVTWIEGIHLGSEMADYYTLYYVTVVDPFAILLSLSIEKNAYKERIAVLKDAIFSLKINVKAAAAAENSKNSLVKTKANSSVTKNEHVDATTRKTTVFILIIGFIVVASLLAYAIFS